MVRSLLSSGDLLVDRRFAYAEALAAEGDHVAARDMLAEIAAMAPRWLPGWMALAAATEKTGDLPGAAAAYDEAALLDGEGRFGAALHRDRLADRRAVTTMPPAYVASLFDDYADRFDRHLLEGLAYDGPETIRRALAASGAPPRHGRTLDLGCGTGLMGRAIRPVTDHLAGVDLSAAMIAKARESGLYDTLTVGSLEDALAATAGSLDLVLAADVLVYCGALEGIAAAMAAALRPGGLVAATLQEGDAPIRLGDDMRFSHGQTYIRDTLAGSGLDVLHLERVSTRREGGRPVPGLVVVARRP